MANAHAQSVGRRESCKLQLIQATTNIYTCSNFLLDGSGAVAIATVAGSNSAKFLMDNVQVTFKQSVNGGEVRGWGLGEF